MEQEDDRPQQWADRSSRLVSSRRQSPTMLVVLEGVYDIRFLRHASSVLHVADPSILDLAALESARKLTLVPLGGGNPSEWPYRFEGLLMNERHIYDREEPPATRERELAIEALNRRTGCSGRIMSRRGMENFFHPKALSEATGVELAFGDNDDVPLLLAKCRFESEPGAPPWESLTPHQRKRIRERIKRILHTRALERMSAERFDEQDPGGEIREWLAWINDAIAPRNCE